MTDKNDTYLSHYPNATHHTTSDTNMSFIEINTKEQFKLHIHTTVPELFIQAFQSFVPDIKKLGLHSLRSGGATTCVRV
jgi:calcineurin-like phosphoesterase family protein